MTLLLPARAFPQIVVFLFSAVLDRPAHARAWASTATVGLLSEYRLGFLSFLAAGSIHSLLRQRPGKLAITGWLISAVITDQVVAELSAPGYVGVMSPVGLALTTAALGTLLPVLRDNDMSAAGPASTSIGRDGRGTVSS